MKIFTKEYGWERAHFDQWIRASLFCRNGNHNKYSLREGHPFRLNSYVLKYGWCRSDNCNKCKKCGIESHD